jgi:glucose/arabinose dehydrogenase
VANGLSQPTVVIPAPDGASLLVAERTGRVVIVPREGSPTTPFLEVGVAANGIEQGLLGLAVHPSGEGIFVYYVNSSGHRTLARYDIGANGTADPDSETVLFSLPQPEGSVDIRHYGGNLMFGPDGYLYISLGDGADARGQGQEPATVFGTILRIDVDANDPYGIPPENPFVAGGGAPEVWAFGLRNPWRFTIDPVDELVYVADVGQETWEEVNVLPLHEGGANLGWPSTEGNHCFLDSACDLEAFAAPVVEYGHDEGCSITGGHVYRGSAIPELVGHYFYSDWCGGWIRSFRYDGGAATALEDWEIEGAGQVNAFGTDHDGELLIANYAGEIHRLVPVR